MRKFIYTSLVIALVSAAAYLLILHLNNVEIAKQTKMMNDELISLFRKKEPDQNKYLNIDVILEKYPKSDVKLRNFAKECRDFFEESYDFQQKYKDSFENVARMTLSTISALINSEDSPLDKMYAELRALQKKQKELNFHLEKELNFHLEEVNAYLCDKYGIDCKAEKEATAP